MVEKAVNSKKTAKAKAAKKSEAKGIYSSIPIYLGVLLLLVGLVGGYIIKDLTAEPPVIPVCDDSCDDAIIQQPAEPGTINAELVYASDCLICEKNHTFLLVLASNNINVNLKHVDVRSDEDKGPEIWTKYDFEIVPILLIDAATVNDDIKIKTSDGKEWGLKTVLEQVVGAPIVKDRYLVYERFFDGMPHNVMFFESPDAWCGTKDNSVRVDEFADYFCSACYAALDDLNKLKEEFGESMEFNFNNFVINESQGSNAAAFAAECARNLGFFDEFHECAYTKRFEGEADTSSQAVLSSCLVDLNRVDDLNAFNECFMTGETFSEVQEDINMAMAYGLGWTPSFVIDCTYVTVGVENLKTNICALHPDLNACAVPSSEAAVKEQGSGI